MTEWNNEIVKIQKIEKHPNADTLDIATVLNGFNVIVKSGDFNEGDLATYISVDSLIPTDHILFSFLKEEGKSYYRVKAKKIRSVFSMGLLVPALEGALEGEDVVERLGIKKYERPGDREYNPNHDKSHKERRSETAPYERKVYTVTGALYLLSLAIFHSITINAVMLLVGAAIAYGLVRYNRKISKRPTVPIYDIESLRKYHDVFQEGESVWISEKIHGSNLRAIHTGKKFHVGSRTMFRPKNTKLPQVDGYNPGRDIWWMIAEKYDLEKKLKNHPNIVLFGEVYGAVQDLNYGVPKSEGVRFAAFDAMHVDTRQYIAMAEGKSVMPKTDHCREGIVVKPIHEQRDNRIGRKFLKLAGQQYMLRKSDT